MPAGLPGMTDVMPSRLHGIEPGMGVQGAVQHAWGSAIAISAPAWRQASTAISSGRVRGSRSTDSISIQPAGGEASSDIGTSLAMACHKVRISSRESSGASGPRVVGDRRPTGVDQAQ